ncbi:MAG: response regulator transcription factor [Cyanobacteria bacterium SZAS LIN-2]|nr:response regulator transcription factor [Cyanobacteria bacterium SZAS LIN-2]
MAKILIIEDETQLANIVRRWLLKDGHVVEVVNNGADGMQRLRFDRYDLVVLDWNLPEVEGIDILKDFRARGGNTSILMLTGRRNVEERVHGLETGADDYLPKPFDGKELMARIRALLKRPQIIVSTVLKAADIELDTKTHTARRAGELLDLLPKEFALLEFLMRHPNQFFEPSLLLEHVWPSESDSTTEALTSCVKRLRKKIDREGENSVIRNVRGAGYGLFADGPEI